MPSASAAILDRVAADVAEAVGRVVAERNARLMVRARAERQLEQDAELLSSDEGLPPGPYEVVPGRQLAIKIRGLSVRQPDDEAFVRATLVLVATADRDARRLAAGEEEPGERGAGAHRRLAGRCVGCGCPRDERTVGCRNCQARHSARRKALTGPSHSVRCAA